MKNILILLSFLSIFTPAFCAIENSLPEIMQKDRMLRPYVRDLISNSSCERKTEILDTLESPELFLKLNYNTLMQEAFGTNGWIPHVCAYENTALQELFAPYRSKFFTSDIYMIFLANVLYDAGSRLYDQGGSPYHLEHAASIGHAKAQLKMFFVTFKLEKGVEAKNYLFCSAAQGNENALLTLSEIYEGYRKIDISKDLAIAKLLCQEAAKFGNPEAKFNIMVATLIEGTFNSQKNYQQGIRKAKDLADSGNEHAQSFLNAIMRSSGDALQEGNNLITYEDLNFLRDFLGWKDEREESFFEV